ncbi:CocE/NonD family hydrolase [Vibrio splendidus]|uniref:CocE/NonD family hydrolase n=1 Tax=Vibrio splendidus TaxID=29497 RepID=UPI002469BF44|nr:CocE/NonD family hydrolase [Vibrio splendidus]MDH5975553.1 CocE/NonD family hydrolase [Vibrio splendidus]
MSTTSLSLPAKLAVLSFIFGSPLALAESSSAHNSCYLYDTSFVMYDAGFESGRVKFTSDGILKEALDPKTRKPLGLKPFTPDFYGEGSHGVDLAQIYSNLDGFCDSSWSTDSISLKGGNSYSRHTKYDGVLSGKSVQSQIWAQRDTSPVFDIITVDKKVVGFVYPGRQTMQIVIKKGYEQVTPLIHNKYLEENISTAKYGINELGKFMVPMRDDTKLSTLVYLPEGIKAGEKVPTILIRTCYGKEGEYAAFEHYVSRGYAVVIQDVRGMYESEGGDFLPYYHERDDSSDTIDWIASQEWSDSNVGMWGASYFGYVVMAAAGSGNPNLKAVVSEVNVGSPFNAQIRPGGTVGSWAGLDWVFALGKNIADYSILGKVDPTEIVETRPLKNIPKKIMGIDINQWDVFSEHYEYDEFWKHSSLTEYADNIKAAVMINSGWHDGCIRGVAEAWDALKQADVPRKITLGPWPHRLNASRDMLDYAYGNNAVDYGYDVETLKWFDQYLKGKKTGIDKEPVATYYVDTVNAWNNSEQWPPLEVTHTNIYLDSKGNANSSTGDGTVTLIKPKSNDGDEDTYQYDPNNASGRPDAREPQPQVYNDLQNRADTLIYTSEKLVNDVAMVGEAFTEFYASSSALSTDWYFVLLDIDENGVSRKVGDSVLNAEYRNGLNNRSLLEPGKIEKYRMKFPYQAHTFKKNHQLQFMITSSNKYTMFPNTNTGLDPFKNEITPIIATQKIYHDQNYPSHVSLPILSGAIEFH